MKPDARRIHLRSLLQDLHSVSHGSAGASNIATWLQGLQDGALPDPPVDEGTGLVSFQQPAHRYKRGGQKHIAIPCEYL